MTQVYTHMKPKEIIKNGEKFKTKWKFLLVCDGCGIEKLASYKYYQLIKPKPVYRCIKCAVDINRHIISENMRNKWKDTDYRNMITDKISDTVNDNNFKNKLDDAFKN